MDGKLKIFIIIGWIVCVSVLQFLLSKYLPMFHLFFTTELGNIVIILLAIVSSALILQFVLQFFLRGLPEHEVETMIPGLHRSPEEAFVGALNDWNIYGVRLHLPMHAHTFLSRRKIDWLSDYVSFPEEIKSQMMERARMADQKLYILRDDEDYNRDFSVKLIQLFEEKKLDYEVLLSDSDSFLEKGTVERIEILETRDSLEVLLGFIGEFEGAEIVANLTEKLNYEDKILKEVTEEDYELECEEYEVQMRPPMHWWWKGASVEGDGN